MKTETTTRQAAADHMLDVDFDPASTPEQIAEAREAYRAACAKERAAG